MALLVCAELSSDHHAIHFSWAIGGWACAVNNYTDPVKKRLAIEFCAFASSKGESIKGTIPNATTLVFNGQDPFRESQLNISLYVNQGYEETTSRKFIETIRLGLSSPNAVTDIRFPTATDIYDVLDREFHVYLNLTKLGLISESSRQMVRADLAKRMTSKWKDIISSYDAQASTKVSVLEAYQKLQGVFVPDVDLNYISRLRGFGYALASIITLSSLLFAAWAIVYRKAPVVRASQPLFLFMICLGALVFGSALFPLGIDDSIASIDGCSKACMSIPWLLALGWTILFSGLFAKLRRVNIVFRNATRFRRVVVTHRDVLLPVSASFRYPVCLADRTDMAHVSSFSSFLFFLLETSASFYIGRSLIRFTGCESTLVPRRRTVHAQQLMTLRCGN